ncbi:MAG TPA: hypothetical protein VGC71_10155 [Gaiellales bacterium]|jgi:hypothetical protein
MARRRNRGTCIFCGNTADSKEDAIPKWIRPLLTKPTDARIKKRRRYGGVQQPDRLEDTIVLAVRNHVCQTCNNGWMSDLQQLAQPTLGPMIAGTPLSIPTGGQLALAAWLTMTDMVLEAESREPAYYTQLERTALAASGTAPDRTTLWLAKRSSSLQVARGYSGNITFAQAMAPDVMVVNGHTCTLSIGQAVLQNLICRPVEGKPWPRIADDAGVAERWRDSTIKIDGPPDATVTWPPIVPLDDLGLLALTHRWRHLGK